VHCGCALNDEEIWSWAAKEIWDRLDGKPQQTVEASIDEKRSALDWTTEELVAWLSEHASDDEGAPEAQEGDHQRLLMNQSRFGVVTSKKKAVFVTAFSNLNTN
jgi:hypothetical protein